jgi:amino acid efflux transporter
MSVHEHGPVVTEGTPALQRRIGLGSGVALYVSAILGAGVLVLPGQVASLAGPSSLVAWAFSCLLGVPLALTFAALATRMPGAGGVATFATRAFGPSAGGVVGWWYLTAGSVGQTIVPLTGGYYVSQALGSPQWSSFPIALGILALAVAANLAGLRVSSRVQVALALAVGAVLVTAAVSAAPDAGLQQLHPFAPHGLAGTGRAVVVLFFAFAGWEAVAHLSGEFRDVRRDLRRATLVTVVVVSVLYLAIACAVVLTGTYGSPQTDRLAIGLLLQHSLGVGASASAGVAALVISLGTTNAFVASVARLGYALGGDGWLPRPLAHISGRDVPSHGVLLVGGIGAAGTAAAWVFGWGTEDLVVVPSTLVIVTYLVGTGAGVRLLEGRARVAAVLALALTLCVLPFAATHLLVPVLVAAASLGYRRFGGGGRRDMTP